MEQKPTFKDLPLADLGRKEINALWIQQRRELFRRLKEEKGQSYSSIAKRYNTKRQNVAHLAKQARTYQPE